MHARRLALDSGRWRGQHHTRLTVPAFTHERKTEAPLR
jgi:hypothetical protein